MDCDYRSNYIPFIMHYIHNSTLATEYSYNSVIITNITIFLGVK